MENYQTIFEQLIAHVEHEVIEFKTAENQFDTNKLGKYLSALSNEANLRDVEFAWILMGVNNNRQVVGNKHIGQVLLILQFLQEVNDLRLNGHIQSGNGLVADDELGPQRQRTGDADTLSLTAGELVRITVEEILL